MTDFVRVELKLTRSALDLLVSCASIGVEGAEGNLADIDDVTDIIDALEPFVTTSPNDEISIDQTADHADALAEARGFELGKRAYHEAPSDSTLLTTAHQCISNRVPLDPTQD